MMNILFYTPFDQRARDVESVILELRLRGHNVASLCTGSGGHFHAFLSQEKIPTYRSIVKTERKSLYFLRQVYFLVKFCRMNGIDVVISHLEINNFIVVLAQYFMPAKAVIVRHHVDEAELAGFASSLAYRLTYRFARRIIAVSSRAADYMIKVEKVRPERIRKINLAYDFSLFSKPNDKFVLEVKNSLGADLILISVGRFNEFKRIDVSIDVLKECVERGVNASLIILGRGQDEGKLRDKVKRLMLSDRVLFPGYVANVSDFLAAADFLIHPSVSESSCVVVKEAALAGTPVIVCEGVGDFDDYIKHGVNGFRISVSNFTGECVEVIQSNWRNVNLEKLGQRLKYDVVNIFDIKRVVKDYEKLISE